MTNVLWFKEISDLNLNQVGNKALSISKIFNNNIPVPNGFCIPYEVFDSFQEETKIKAKIEEILSSLDINNLNSLYTTSEKIQNLVINANMPIKLKQQIIESYENINVDIDVYKMAGKNALEIIKAGRESTYVAVRTSPLNSSLNHQPNALNIKGKEELIKTIQKCWASMFSANSLNMKIKNKIPLTDARTAIIIQKMIDAEKSGIVYTSNPDYNKNEIVIEACLGQGEVITTGSIIPDKYTINKTTKEVIEKSINKQDFMLTKDDNIGKNIKRNLFNNEEQKITDMEINKVVSYALQIENIYKHPQEIEFCINKDKVFFLQSKPIINIYAKEYTDEIEEELSKKEQRILVRGLNASLGLRSGYVNIIKNNEELENLKENQILVIKSCNYINLNLLDSNKLKKLSGVVTDNDNLDSPLARIARDFGIPCIVSTTDSTRILKNDQFVTIDGNTGVIYEEIEKKHGDKLIDYYNTATEIKVIIDNKEEIMPDSERNDGVGLLKINLDDFYLTIEKEELIDQISKEIESEISFFKNKPIWYYLQNINNENILDVQLKSIKKLQDKGINNIGVAIPSITEISQIKVMKQKIKEINIEPLEEIDFGIVIDTPASSILIKEFCDEQIDFIVIDLVKLTAATLNINENDEKYNENHLSVLKQISNITKTCRKLNIETSIIGRTIFEPEFVEFLVKNGVDSLICNIKSVNEAKNKIAKSEKRLILNVVRKGLAQ